MKIKALLRITAFFAAVFLLTNCIHDSLEISKENFPGRIMEVTANISDDTPQTRVSLKQDGLNINLTWNKNDKVYLLIVYEDEGVEKKETKTVTIQIDPENNKKATFSLVLPDGDYTTFDLYGVYGGYGFDLTNPEHVNLPNIAITTSSSLKELEKNKSVVLVFSKTGIHTNNPNLGVNFGHIGSLFNIKLKNTGGIPLNNVTEVYLTADSAIPAYKNTGDHVYNVITGTFSGGAQTQELVFKPVSSSNIAPNGILELWAWVPMEKDEGWPAFHLQVVSNGSLIETTAEKGARNNVAVGKTYYLFATYNDSALSFATEEDMTVDPDKLADFRDGSLYNKVELGDQVWMAENLKYLPFVNPSSWGSDSAPYCYVYGHSGYDVAPAKATDKYKTYGVLYNWNIAMGGSSSSTSNPSGVQGVCPDGWHLPSDAEWKQLEMFLGMSAEDADKVAWRGANEGKQLKETGFAHWTMYTAHEGTNSTGFTALPGGSRTEAGSFMYNGNTGYWWSSTQGSAIDARFRCVTYNHSDIHRHSLYKRNGFSVRCVKDQSV